MSEYTPEPWRVGRYHYSDVVECQSGNILLSKIEELDNATGIANARRIVACVNACAGMADPEAEIARIRAEALKEAADRAVTWYRQGQLIPAHKDSFAIKQLRAAILADEPKEDRGAEGPCCKCVEEKGAPPCEFCGPPAWEAFQERGAEVEVIAVCQCGQHLSLNEIDPYGGGYCHAVPNGDPETGEMWPEPCGPVYIYRRCDIPAEVERRIEEAGR